VEHPATLRCGSVLVYEAVSFVPAVGEVVPCRRHGFCEVAAGRQGEGGARRAVRRPTQQELLVFLRRRRAVSVHALRKNGFTLRMVMAAERDGLVEVDLREGRIALRGAAG
jgi:hypothetical protein